MVQQQTRSKTLWEARRQKARVLNPSRRRVDYRTLVRKFKAALAKGEISHEERTYSPFGKLIKVGGNPPLIQKKPADVPYLKLFEKIVREKKNSHIEVVHVKSSRKSFGEKMPDPKRQSTKPSKVFIAQQYVRRPSLEGLLDYLEARVDVPREEQVYCKSLIRNLAKRGISEKKLLHAIQLVEGELFIAWKADPRLDSYARFSFSNILVCDIAKSGKVKIAIIDV